jgi:vancomycin permeability regulator SanA
MLKSYGKIFMIAGISVLGYFLFITGIILFKGNVDYLKPADYIVVLGNKVNSDGKPSDRLRARLDKTIDLYQNNMAKKIIVTGGLGKEGYNEAGVMKDYLVKQNIPTENVLVDSKGLDTFQSAVNTKKMLASQLDKPIILVSQHFHLWRSENIFEKCGLRTVYTAHANYYELRDFYSVFREFFALHKYLFVVCK